MGEQLEYEIDSTTSIIVILSFTKKWNIYHLKIKVHIKL